MMVFPHVDPGWVLLVHGGAGGMTRASMAEAEDRAARAALARALEAGGAVLDEGGSALDAVEAAVRLLEDDPNFNAGRGAALARDGTVELDAAIMDGQARDAGAVAGLRTTRNPVSAARAVMDHSPHAMFAGPGADLFARAQRLEQVAPDFFVTERRRRELDAMRDEGGAPRFDHDLKYGTVGAVARDVAGNLAAATSTGGLAGKAPGRIGDTAVIGAGTWADNRGCAVSATGSGEFYIREGAAHEISARVRFLHEPVGRAADAVQAELFALGGIGGVIAVAADGSPAWSFNTPGMYRGLLRSGMQPRVAIYGDE